jgi:hypothetical protein
MTRTFFFQMKQVICTIQFAFNFFTHFISTLCIYLYFLLFKNRIKENQEIFSISSSKNIELPMANTNLADSILHLLVFSDHD